MFTIQPNTEIRSFEGMRRLRSQSRRSHYPIDRTGDFLQRANLLKISARLDIAVTQIGEFLGI